MTYLEIYKHVKHVIVEVAEQPYIHHDLRQRVVKLTNQTKVPLDLRPMEDYLKTHDTSILMYNRVPKTGSSSMRTMLINLARVCDFMNWVLLMSLTLGASISSQRNSHKLVSLSINEFALRSWERSWQEAEVDRILKAKQQHRGKTIIYIQHVHFISKEWMSYFGWSHRGNKAMQILQILLVCSSQSTLILWGIPSKGVLISFEWYYYEANVKWLDFSRISTTWDQAKSAIRISICLTLILILEELILSMEYLWFCYLQLKIGHFIASGANKL